MILFAFSNCPPPGDENTPPTITISGPESKYYTALPATIDYTLSEDCPTVVLSLNGVEIDPADELTGSVTGLNTLTITATDADGATDSKAVTYFYNDLALTDSDDFDRADNKDIGLGWNETDIDEILEINVHSLASLGCANPDSYPNIKKTYDGSSKTEVLQKIDICSMSQATPTQVFLILWDFSDFNEAGEYYEQVQAQLETVREDGTFQGHKLLLTYFGMEWGTWQTISGALAATDTLQLDFSNPISLLYYKNGDDYAAVIYDDNDNLMPNDESGSPDVSISTDNYEYY